MARRLTFPCPVPFPLHFPFNFPFTFTFFNPKLTWLVRQPTALLKSCAQSKNNVQIDNFLNVKVEYQIHKFDQQTMLFAIRSKLDFTNMASWGVTVLFFCLKDFFICCCALPWHVVCLVCDPFANCLVF